MRRLTLILLSFSFLAGCTHLKGVVLEDPTQRPMKTAVISVGRPTGIAVLATHPVNDRGTFDFYLLPGDETNLYLYDGAADPEMTMRHLDQAEIGDKMTLHLRRALKSTPSMPIDVNINP
ncbi:MAG TPA: hypothetical protein VGN88_03275 [Phycisphaerae bacterium]|jgi:hypothetical protein